MAIIVQSIILNLNQEDVRFVDLLDTKLLAPDQSSRRRRMLSMMRTLGMKMSNGKSLHGRLKSMKLPKVRKEKERSQNQKESRRARLVRALRDLLLRGQLKPRLLENFDLIPEPNQKLDHAWRTTYYLR